VEITHNWRSYVHTLIEMATNAAQSKEILATSFLRPSQLVRRLELIISARRPSRSRIAASLFGILVALFLTGFLSVSRLPLTASLSPPVPVESQVRLDHLLSKVEPVYPEGADSLLDRNLVLRVLVDRTGRVVRARASQRPSQSGVSCQRGGERMAVQADRSRSAETAGSMPVEAQIYGRRRDEHYLEERPESSHG